MPSATGWGILLVLCKIIQPWLFILYELPEFSFVSCDLLWLGEIHMDLLQKGVPVGRCFASVQISLQGCTLQI